MACEPDVMAAESAYVRALGRADAVAFRGADLVLSGDEVRNGSPRCRRCPTATWPATRWVLETVVDGEVASSTPGESAVLLLDPDSTVDASTGCRSVTGTWLLEDGALVIDDLLVDGDCPPEVAPQDAHVAAVLASGPTAEVDEDQLTLTAPDGRGLVYRAG